MAAPAIGTKAYVVVCVLLILLTVLTVAVSFLELPGSLHLFLGLVIAACKATLVVLFFMHVLVSGRLTWMVLAVVCFWLAILFALTLGDYFTRGMVPHMPGH
jgi:cytochrome c oxidase subunit 4